MSKTRPISRAIWVLFLTGIMALTLAACQAITPPRLATRQASTAPGPAPTAEKLFVPAPTATANPAGVSLSAPVAAPQLNVWLNETSPEHRQLAAEMARDFTERTGIDLAVQLISSPDLPDLVHTAVLSDTLPDVIIHPLEYTIAWTEAGILDPDAGDEIVNQIGRETFDPAALDLVDHEGKVAAIPSDGYQQLLIYRSDWFEEQSAGYAGHIRGHAGRRRDYL